MQLVKFTDPTWIGEQAAAADQIISCYVMHGRANPNVQFTHLSDYPSITGTWEEFVENWEAAGMRLFKITDESGTRHAINPAHIVRARQISTGGTNIQITVEHYECNVANPYEEIVKMLREFDTLNMDGPDMDAADMGAL